MKRSSKDLKKLAREALIGNYGNFAVVFLIYFVITFAVEMIPSLFSDNSTTSGIITAQVVACILSLIISLLSVGLQKTAINITRREPVNVGDLFYAFRHHPDKYIIVSFLMALIAVLFQIPTILLLVIMLMGNFSINTGMAVVLIILLALILLLISVIVLLRYSLATILLMEHPEMSALESMQVSSQLMQGNKGRYFYLGLSFIGLELLALLTCGIAYFWLTPYTMTTYMQFYREVTGELDGDPRETDFTEYQDYWS